MAVLPPPVIVSSWIPIQIWCSIMLAALPSPAFVYYWIPIQIWCNILSWLTCLILWSFLNEFLSKMMQYPLLGALPPPVVISYWIPIPWLPCILLLHFLLNPYANMIPFSSRGCLASSCGLCLLNPCSNMMQHPLLAVLPPPVIVSYWIPIQIWCSILCWLPCLPLHSFIILSLFKYDAISSLGCLVSSWVNFLLNFYANMKQ